MYVDNLHIAPAAAAKNRVKVVCMDASERCVCLFVWMGGRYSFNSVSRRWESCSFFRILYSEQNSVRSYILFSESGVRRLGGCRCAKFSRCSLLFIICAKQTYDSSCRFRLILFSPYFWMNFFLNSGGNFFKDSAKLLHFKCAHCL